MKVIINREFSWFLWKEEQINAGGVQGMQPQPAPGTSPGRAQAKAIQGGKSSDERTSLQKGSAKGTAAN